MESINLKNKNKHLEDNLDETLNHYNQNKSWKGIALWLIENTAISFKQIASFCGLHPLEIEALANDETGEKITPYNPILMQLLDENTIELCSKDPSKQLSLPAYNALAIKLASKQSKSKYVTITKKKDKPDAIAWIIKNYPYISDNQIMKLIGTTKNTIQTIKDKTYKGMKNLKPRSPVVLGLCTNEQLENTIMYAKVFHDRMKIENNE
jgi:hypothetical protein